MGKPRFLSENFYSVAQFPLHTIVGDNPVVGGEAFRIGTARRGTQNAYQAGSDAAVSLIVTCDRVRSADLVVIDRNTNLEGFRIIVRGSNDGFNTFESILDDTLSTDVVYGSSLLDSSHWIKTNEGAFIARFDERAFLAYLLRIDTTASGTSARVGGVYLGKSYVPDNPVLPHDDESRYVDFSEIRRGLPDNDQRYGRSGSFSMKMTDEEEWARARLTLRELPAHGHPIWVTPDQDQAERTWLGYVKSVAAPYTDRPQGRDLSLALEEYHPQRPV